MSHQLYHVHLLCHDLVSPLICGRRYCQKWGTKAKSVCLVRQQTSSPVSRAFHGIAVSLMLFLEEDAEQLAQPVGEQPRGLRLGLHRKGYLSPDPLPTLCRPLPCI